MSTDTPGPLPEPAYPDCYQVPRTGGVTWSGYSAKQMRSYALQERAAERERWAPRNAELLGQIKVLADLLD
jgi:hypothetical protein